MLAGAAVAVSAAAVITPASVSHGITFLKGCDSPVTIGDPYLCSFTVSQNVTGDTVTITGLTDAIPNATSPTFTSGPILSSLTLTLSGGATCNIGQTQCTLPAGGQIDNVANPFSWHTVTAADYGAPSHLLTDQATVTWTDVCTGLGAGNCPVGTQSNQSASSATVVKAPSNTSTVVMSSGSPVTAPLAAPATVTDVATVSGTAGTPTGTVSFTFFSNGTCDLNALPAPTAAGTITLDVTGKATSNSEGPLSAGSYAFQATYNGDGTYLTSTGDCEPFTVTKNPSNTSTVVMSSGSPVTAPLAAPATVTDVATVSGTAGTPTGTVSFTFFSNGTCDLNALPAPTAAGTITLDVTGKATSNSEGPLSAGSYAFQATYNGDGTYLTSTGDCEPFTVTTPATANLTPGFWKNHQQATQALLPLPLGTFSVTTFATARAVLSEMGCGSVGALNCMAGMLLAAELNLAQGGSTCIGTLSAPLDPTTVIGQANLLLIKYSYNGPGHTFTLSSSDRTAAMTLHDLLSAYNIDGVPTC